jgi:hypothetical protein
MIAIMINGCLTWMLQTEPYKKLLKILPDYTQGNNLSEEDYFKYNEKRNIIFHNYGQFDGNHKIKYTGLLNVKHNKYWAPYFNDLIPEKTEETE